MTTIVPIKLPKPEDEKEDDEPHPMARMLKNNASPSTLYSRGIADYVFAVPGDEKEFFPYFGITGSYQKNGINISRIAKNGIAHEYGLKKGDKIIKIDGVEITSLEQFRTLLATKGWEETVEFQLSKQVKVARKKE
jgi:C-terminal processing protease CtpA/Prc